MNKDNAHLYLPLVQDLADGKLQILIGGKWVSVAPDQQIEFVYPPDQYRRKPEPREWWQVRSAQGNAQGAFAKEFPNEQDARAYAETFGHASLIVVHVREVLPQ